MWPADSPEYEILQPDPPRLRLQQLDGLRAQWHIVRSTVLDSVRRQPDDLPGQIDFRPAQPANFFTPLAGQHQEFDSGPVNAVRKRMPDFGEFRFREHPVAVLAPATGGADHRVDVYQTFADRPREE